jgi:AraC-like DNA-binding protein
MQSHVINYNTEESKAAFELQSGIRPWAILMVIKSGKYTLEFPETGQSFTVFPNMISYIPPNTVFARKILQPIHFHQFHVHYVPEDPFAQALTPGILPIPQAQVAAISESLLCIPSATYREEMIQHLFEHILKENYLFSLQSSENTHSESIDRVIAYMKEHLSEPMSLDTMAKVAGLSRSGLIWKFNRQFKTTPQQYFIQLRMQLAKQLLLESDLSISHIADKCGYDDIYYFSNAFRKNVGVSPSSFRKALGL